MLDNVELVLRPAEEKDVEAIAEIEKICFATPWSADAVYKEITSNPIAHYIIGEIDGQVVGYVGFWQILDEGHITNVAVRPEFRGNHIGSALIAIMIEIGTSLGLTRYTLEVRSSNEPAKALYRNFNFKEAGLRKGYYEDNGEDAVIMWRDPMEPAKN
jgi:ribosomal-protein-alanine N-acetyltransferase